MPSIEISTQPTPPRSAVHTGNSPKRPLPLDDSDTDSGRPQKIARGESPLKGAAGRRLDQHKRDRKANTPQYDGPALPQPPPPSLPRDLLFFLSILPKANSFYAPKYKAEGLVKLLQTINIPNNISELQPHPGARAPLPQQVPTHLQQVPTPQIAHLHQFQPIQQMSPLPPALPPQYGQYNSGYPAFPMSKRNPFSTDHRDGGELGANNVYHSSLAFHRPSSVFSALPTLEGPYLTRLPPSPPRYSHDASGSSPYSEAQTAALRKHFESKY